MSNQQQQQDKTKALMRFKQSLLDLVQRALADGVPVQNVILELSMEQFQQQANLLHARAEQAAGEATRVIVSAPAGLDLGQLPKGGR